jgi:hypothetical protein
MEAGLQRLFESQRRVEILWPNGEHNILGYSEQVFARDLLAWKGDPRLDPVKQGVFNDMVSPSIRGRPTCAVRVSTAAILVSLFCCGDDSMWTSDIRAVIPFLIQNFKTLIGSDELNKLRGFLHHLRIVDPAALPGS